MYRRYVGTFNKKLGLLKPSEAVRDSMGGFCERTYTLAGHVFAQLNSRSHSQRDFGADSVDAITEYFIIRDERSLYPIDKSWKLEHDGYRYNITAILALDEPGCPPYLEIHAVKVGGY